MNASSAPTVIVGMSGGVDSAVAAHLLVEEGYRVAGLFMKNWEEDDDAGHCAAAQDRNDAQQVCNTLKIPLHTVNFSHEYWERVFTHFLDEYRAGRTPNPDILCNQEIKFRAFLGHARTLGAERIATGHYARIDRGENGFRMRRGCDRDKDQSYFLYRLAQWQLAEAIFPLGERTKSEVRTLARQAGFTNHGKKDSTGLCFIGERRFRDFLARFLPAQPGEIITAEGRRLGTHQGLMYYTLGQRNGLRIGGQTGLPEAPWYVIDKDMASNRLIVAQDRDHPRLLSRTVWARQLHWISGRQPAPTAPLTARVRHRQTTQPCRLHLVAEDWARIEFDRPQWAVTPGQSLVLYRDETCLGGGVIEPHPERRA